MWIGYRLDLLCLVDLSHSILNLLIRITTIMVDAKFTFLSSASLVLVYTSLPLPFFVLSQPQFYFPSGAI